MKNKIDVIIGVGKLKPGKLDVTDENNKQNTVQTIL
jgi:dihydrolipoamide dehydrogenase